jgi:hypothetical protein
MEKLIGLGCRWPWIRKDAMRRTVMVLALTSLQTVGATPAATDTWTWFRSVSTGSEWWTTQGKGDVNISRGVFSATLRDGDDPRFTRLSLAGSVSGGLVKARVTVQESDDPVVEVTGRLRLLCWATKGGRQVLMLTNGEQVVGLFRDLDPSLPCRASLTN